LQIDFCLTINLEQILAPWIEFEQIEEIMQKMEEKRKAPKNVKLIELVNVRSHIQSLSVLFFFLPFSA
jgi:hypothetical protein